MSPQKPVLALLSILVGCGGDLSTAPDWTDADGDGFPDYNDCDDDDAEIHPFADESCNGLDDDCDGEIDEASAVDAGEVYPDLDADGYGDPRYPVRSCSLSSGYVADAGDCDDLDAATNPAGTEVCDGADNDCNGLFDGDDPGLQGDMDVFWEDADNDGFGDPDSPLETCVEPSGYVDNDDDCDDSAAEANPDETEVCGDGLDNDCDGTGNDCGLSGTESLSDAQGYILSDDESDYAGLSVVDAGDTDGDGINDVIVGAYYADGTYTDYGGVAYVVTGPISGQHSLADAIALESLHDGDYTGWAVAGLGDLDGDGYSEVAVGAPYDDGGASDGGGVYVFSGPLEDTSLPNADSTILGQDSNDYLGWAVVRAGDLDDDGTDDLAVSAVGSDTSSSDAGAVYIFSGPVDALGPSGAMATLTGEEGSDNAGYDIAAAGDTDGDGVDDFWVGAPGEDTNGSGAGTVYLVRGPIAGTVGLAAASARILGPSSSYGLGNAIGGGGDLDGDGLADVALGSRSADSYTGHTYVFHSPISGTLSATSADAVLAGAQSYDYSGFAVSISGDMDSDGIDDLVLGAPEADSSTTSSTGAVYLFTDVLSGTLGVSAATAVLEGESGGDYASAAVSIAGDVSGDGAADLLVGAPYSDRFYSDGGLVYVQYGGGI